MSKISTPLRCWLRRSWYLGYLLAVSVASAVVKASRARDVQTSALFADDYYYLNHIIPGFDATAGPSGGRVLYSYLVAPWKWVEGFDRFQVVFLINIVLVSLFVLFSSSAVWRLTGKRSILAPLCLASLAVACVINFYALTENALYPVVGAAVWLIAGGPEVFRGKKFLALAGLAAVGPLIRVPAIAVTAGGLAALWSCRRKLGKRFAARRAGELAAAAVGPYFLFSLVGRGGGRESVYLDLLRGLQRVELEQALVPVTLMVGQLGYLLLASAVWALPLAAVWMVRLDGQRYEIQQNAGEATSAAFILGCSLTFFGAALFHLIMRQIDERADGPFFFIGRYLDPVVILLYIAALVFVLNGREPERPLKLVAFLFVPMAGLSLLVALGGVTWRPVGYNGLALLAEPAGVYIPLFVACVVTGVVYLASTGKSAHRAAGSLLVLSWIALNAWTVRAGLDYTIRRSAVVGRSLEGAAWLVRNSSETDVICLDGSVRWQPAPNSIKQMANVFRGMRFLLYPRTVVETDDHYDPGVCDYFFTLEPERQEVGEVPESLPVWSSNSYVIFSGSDPTPPPVAARSQ